MFGEHWALITILCGLGLLVLIGVGVMHMVYLVDQLREEDGELILCELCSDPIEDSDPVSTAPNGKLAHFECAKDQVTY